MLELKKINVKIDEKQILKNFNLKINKGEIHAIMGPNGVGKSTLSALIMGHPKIKVVGHIIYNGEDITELPPNIRANKGIFLAMQYPSQLEGVSNLQFLKAIVNANQKEKIPLFELYKKIDNEKQNLNMPDEYLKRMVNIGFSGGEKKRNEIMQLKMLSPKLIILDEIDSGLDVDSLKLVTNEINKYYNKDISILIITHYPKILEYIKPDYVHIMKDGQIIKTGDLNLAYQIEKLGYNGND